MKTIVYNCFRQRRTNAAMRRARMMREEGCDPDEIIAHFKECGFSQGMASVALSAIGVGDSAHCKSLVVNSPHWAELKDANIALNQALEEYLDREE